MYNLANQIDIYDATHEDSTFWSSCTFPSQGGITLERLILRLEQDHGAAYPIYDRSVATRHYVNAFFDAHYVDFDRMIQLYLKEYKGGETKTRSLNAGRQGVSGSTGSASDTTTNKNTAFDSGTFTNHDQSETHTSTSTSGTSASQETVSETTNTIKGIEGVPDILDFFGEGLYARISKLFGTELMLGVY